MSAALRRAIGALTCVLPFVATADLSTAGRPAPAVLQAAGGARTFTVDGTAQFHQALDEAQPGDSIVLRPGVLYRGPFTLRNHGPGEAWITIRSVGPPPAAGVRFRPGARVLPRLVASSESVFVAEPGAHHYRLVGLEIAPAPGTFLYNVIDLGSEAGDLAAVPHHIRIEHCYVHGDRRVGSRRGIALNGAHLDVVDSHLSDFKELGADAQAIAGWNGPGPFLIENNYLEAAAENLLFGGADPRIPDLVPADIVIRRNHFSKPLAWRIEDPSYAGEPWVVKNLFELKNARRVTVEYNLFEHNWPHGQDGFAILFTVRNQDGASPWAVVEDVSFANNVVRRVASGILILGRDDNHASRQSNRIEIRNNLFTDVGGNWGDGRLFLLQDGARDVAIEHNTAFHDGSFLLAGDAAPHPGFRFLHNIVQHNEYGAIGGDTGTGRPSIQRYFPGSEFRGNVIVGGDGGLYPGGNFFPRRVEDVGFVSMSDPRLSAGSQFKGRAYGRDPGFDGEALKALEYRPDGWRR
jgi:hypothetical protein